MGGGGGGGGGEGKKKKSQIVNSQKDEKDMYRSALFHSKYLIRVY